MTNAATAILTGAADWLEAHDLHKGSMFGKAGKDYFPKERDAGTIDTACAVGCLRIALFQQEYSPSVMPDMRWEQEEMEARRLLATVIYPMNVITWSDAKERTKDDVVAALRAAAGATA